MNRPGPWDGLFWGLLAVSVAVHVVIFVVFNQWELSSPDPEEEPVPVNVMVRAELIQERPAVESGEFQLEDPPRMETRAPGFSADFPSPGTTETLRARSSRPSGPNHLTMLDRASAPEELDVRSTSTLGDLDPEAPSDTQLPLRGSEEPMRTVREEPEVEYFPVDSDLEQAGQPELRHRPSTPSDVILREDSSVEGSFRILVTESGAVESVEVVDSTGSDDLDQQLIAWIEEWEYEPNSRATRTIVQVASPGTEPDA